MAALRVLIVDDEEELVHTLVERLQLRRIDAVGVTSGAEAVEQIRTASFDVVLVDVKMPGMGGLEVISKIKQHLPQLQVILLTGHGSAQYAEEGMRLGAFDYLMKPVNIDKLIPILRRAGGQREGGGQ